ncbi:MAG: hypothetical protein MSG64_20600 [Pyrinomonadaceae bacterium MAG19_C2-C3]|nr:hypothetical protein [Pyrinomonadaceae bacterium MAG19_C2-C3]
MKESTGAVKRARDGGYVHVLMDNSPPYTWARSEAIVNTDEQPRRDDLMLSPLAPLEVRHAAYERLIALSPASHYSRELLTATPDGLLARGLLPQDASRFGALPPRVSDRDRLADEISRFIKKEFPANTERHNSSGIVGIPGFWLKNHTQPKLGKDYDLKTPALIVPYRNEQGFVQACQLRFAGRRGGYHWLSTAEDCLDREPYGTSSGSPIHWTTPLEKAIGVKDLPVLVTEGALKAEVFVALRPPMRAIASAGVGHAEIVCALRGRHALFGFDIDHQNNEQVCRQLGKLIAKREQDERAARLKAKSEIVVWKGPKGIDEAALQNVRLHVIGITEWSRTLSGGSLKELTDLWSACSFYPCENGD